MKSTSIQVLPLISLPALHIQCFSNLKGHYHHPALALLPKILKLSDSPTIVITVCTPLPFSAWELHRLPYRVFDLIGQTHLTSHLAY